MAINRHYLYTPAGRRVHYRRAGEGPPLIMLHPSPSSSASLEPRIARYAARHTVIALDNPGYGESEQLPIERPSVADYADALMETMTALGLERADLWGTHTGGTVALEAAVRHPARVRRLALDGITFYRDDERQDLLDNYTPSLEPTWEAGHLLRAWTMMRDMRMFSPWYKRLPKNRVNRPLPDAMALHRSFVDFLRAGVDYWKGYHAVFQHDSLAALQKVTVPTLVTSATSDSVAKQLSRVGETPKNVAVEPAADDEATANRIMDFLASDPLPVAPPAPAPQTPPGVPRRDYVSTSIGQLLMRRADGGAGRPLVLLHAMPGSSAYYERLMPEWAKERTVVTFDLPGNGDSAGFPAPPAIGDFARVIGEAMDALGLGEVELYGAHTGALICMELSIARPQQVKHAILDGITLFTEEETADYLMNYCPPMVPTQEGGHTLWAWNFRRDMNLWWPWYRHDLEGLRPEGSVASPAANQAGYVEFMKGALAYHLSYSAAFSYPTRARLPLVPVPILHTSSEVDPLRSCMPEAKALTPAAQARVHKGMFSPEAMAGTFHLFRSFLNGQPLPDGPTE